MVVSVDSVLGCRLFPHGSYQAAIHDRDAEMRLVLQTA